MRPTLRQLKYLVAIAEHGRFGDAARSLNVSQPSLSSQVAEVEATLGVALVERGRHGAIMTPRGEEFVRRARLVLQQVDDLKVAMQTESQSLSGRLRLGVLPTIGPYLLPPVVMRLHGMYPGLKLGIRDERWLDLEAGLDAGRFETIISTAHAYPGTTSLPLFSEALWVCVSLDDPLADGSPTILPQALEGRTLLSLGMGHRLSILVQSLADLAGAHVSSEYEGTSLDALRQMAAMGTGVAILPSLYALCEARRDTGLVLRRIDHPGATREISLIWRETSPLGENFHRLGEVLRDVAGELLEA